MDPNNLPIYNPSFQPAQDGAKFNLKILIIIFVFILSTILITGGLAVALAYEKIDINNPFIEKPVTKFIQSLPFAPKTPKFLLESAVAAHAKISRHSFNVSLSAKSEDFVSSLGFNQIDIEAKGDIDYADPKNLKTAINLSVTKDFNADIRKKDTIVYFKVNKFPAILATLFKLDAGELNSVFVSWVGIDTKPLDTAARRNLDEKSEQNSLTKQYLEDLIGDLLDEKLLPKLTSNKEGPDYKVHLSADDKTLDNFIYQIQDRISGNNQPTLKVDENNIKPSDYIKDLSIDLWINEKYFVKRTVTSFKFNPNFKPSETTPSSVLGANLNVLGVESFPYSLGSSEFSIVMAIEYDNFGKEFNVEVPDKYITFEEFFGKIMESLNLYQSLETGSGSLGITEISKRSRDVTRLTNLAQIQQAISIAIQESQVSLSQLLCNGLAVPCSGRTYPLSAISRASNGGGWVKVNLRDQKAVSLQTLPVDPVNDEGFHYAYCSDGKFWEVNAVLESESQRGKMSIDGGDDNTKYEVGSNLGLIDKTSGCNF